MRVVSAQKKGPGLLKDGALQVDPYEAREASGLTHQSLNSVPNTLASPRVAFGMAMVKSG